MPVSISMSVSETSVDTANNRSLVSVVVTAHYTGGSFNRNDPPLTVTLDGVSDTVNVDFNAGESTSGSETIYSKSWYVGHNTDGTKTLYYSASYVTGVSSGTVSTSGSLMLTPISVPGGGSGGDSGDDDDDSGDSGGTGGQYLTPHPDTNCTYLGMSQDGLNFGNTNRFEGEMNSGYVKFRTPSDLVSCSKLRVAFDTYGVYTEDDYQGISVVLYKEALGESNRISGFFSGEVFTTNTVYSYYYTDINSTAVHPFSLEPNTEYIIGYLNGVSGVELYAVGPPAIILDYVALEKQCYISSENSNDPYRARIEDGTNWYEYEVYVDNGTSWDKQG